METYLMHTQKRSCLFCFVWFDDI